MKLVVECRTAFWFLLVVSLYGQNIEGFLVKAGRLKPRR